MLWDSGSTAERILINRRGDAPSHIVHERTLLECAAPMNRQQDSLPLQNMNRVLKLQFCTGVGGGAPEIRLVPLKRITNSRGNVCYDMLVHRAILLAFADMSTESFAVTMTYMDADGDYITISTTEELEDAINQCNQQQEGKGKTLRLNAVFQRKSTNDNGQAWSNSPPPPPSQQQDDDDDDQNKESATRNFRVNQTGSTTFDSERTDSDETDQSSLAEAGTVNSLDDDDQPSVRDDATDSQWNESTQTTDLPSNTIGNEILETTNDPVPCNISPKSLDEIEQSAPNGQTSSVKGVSRKDDADQNTESATNKPIAIGGEIERLGLDQTDQNKEITVGEPTATICLFDDDAKEDRRCSVPDVVTSITDPQPRSVTHSTDLPSNAAVDATLERPDDHDISSTTGNIHATLLHEYEQCRPSTPNAQTLSDWRHSQQQGDADHDTGSAANDVTAIEGECVGSGEPEQNYDMTCNICTQPSTMALLNDDGEYGSIPDAVSSGIESKPSAVAPTANLSSEFVVGAEFTSNLKLQDEGTLSLASTPNDQTLSVLHEEDKDQRNGSAKNESIGEDVATTTRFVGIESEDTLQNKNITGRTEASPEIVLHCDSDERSISDASHLQSPGQEQSERTSIPQAAGVPSNADSASSNLDKIPSNEYVDATMATIEELLDESTCQTKPKLLDETEQPSTLEPNVTENGEKSLNRQPTIWEMGTSKSPGVVSAVCPQHDSSTGFDATTAGALKARITTPYKAATPTAQPPPAGANPRRDIDITGIVVETVDDSWSSGSDVGTVPSTISPPHPPPALTINLKQAPKEDFLWLLDSDDLDDFESDASQLRNACLSRNAEPTALKSMLEICRSNQQRIERAKNVAAESHQYRKWGELCTTLSVVAKAIDMAEPIVKQGTSDQINPPEARTLKRSVASMVIEKDVFSLICTMRAHDERRLDAAIALMEFARGDDDETKKEIHSQGGNRLLLRLFRTHGISKDLKLVIALAFAHFLPSFVVELSLSPSSISPLFALKIVECLHFLFLAQSVRLRGSLIERDEMQNAVAKGMETFWAHALLPMFYAQRTVAKNDDSHVAGQHDLHGSLDDHTEELMKKTIALVLDIVRCDNLHEEGDTLRLRGLLVAQICALEEARCIAVQEGILNVLFGWIASYDYNLVKVAACALRDLAAIQDQSWASMVHSQMAASGALQKLVTLTLSYEKRLRSVNLAVAETLSIFCQATMPREEVVASQRSIACLVSLLDHEDPLSVEVAYHAGKALLNLASRAIERIRAFTGIGAECDEVSSVTTYEVLLDEIVELGAVGSLIGMADSKFGCKLCLVAVKALRVMSEDTSPERQIRQRLCEDGAADALGRVINDVAVHLDISLASKSRPNPASALDANLMKGLQDALIALANMFTLIRGDESELKSSGNAFRHQVIDELWECVSISESESTPSGLRLDSSITQLQRIKLRAALEACRRIPVELFYDVNDKRRTADSNCHDDGISEVSSYQEPLNSMIAMFAAPLVTEVNPGKYRPIAQPRFDNEKELLWQCLKNSNPDLELTFETATVERLVTAVTKKCTFLHYSGFGRDDRLSFEDGHGKAVWQDQKQLQSSIVKGNVAPFKFVFVTSCRPVAAGEAFVQAGVPHVVCCQQECDRQGDEARAFTRQFYLALAEGQSVKSSFHQGLEAVQELPHFKRGETMEQFSLLPVDGNHDVAVIRASSERSLLGESSQHLQISKFWGRRPLPEYKNLSMRNVMQHDLPPAPPPYFLGRELDMYKILGGVFKNRLVSVVGETGVGRSSVVRAVCHYMNERRREMETDAKVSHIYYVRPKQIQPSVRSHTMIQLLWEKLTDVGKTCTLTNCEDLPQAICKCLSQDKALVVFDRTELLDGSGEVNEFVAFLDLLSKETSFVKVLITGCNVLGKSGGQLTFPLDPLDFQHSVRLLACLCPHLRNEEDRRRFCARMGSDRNAAKRRSCDQEMNERTRAILEYLIKGYPALIAKEIPTSDAQDGGGSNPSPEDRSLPDSSPGGSVPRTDGSWSGTSPSSDLPSGVAQGRKHRDTTLDKNSRRCAFGGDETSDEESNQDEGSDSWIDVDGDNQDKDSVDKEVCEVENERDRDIEDRGLSFDRSRDEESSSSNGSDTWFSEDGSDHKMPLVGQQQQKLDDDKGVALVPRGINVEHPNGEDTINQERRAHQGVVAKLPDGVARLKITEPVNQQRIVHMLPTESVVLKLELCMGVGGVPQIRRVPLKRITNLHGDICYDKLVHLAISRAFPEMPPESFEVTMTYIDADDDCITITTKDELEDAIYQCSQQQVNGILRLKTVFRRTSRPTHHALGNSDETLQNKQNSGCAETSPNHIQTASLSDLIVNLKLQDEGEPSSASAPNDQTLPVLGNTSREEEDRDKKTGSASFGDDVATTTSFKGKHLESVDTLKNKNITGRTEPCPENVLHCDNDERSVSDASHLQSPSQEQSQPSSIPQADGLPSNADNSSSNADKIPSNENVDATTATIEELLDEITCQTKPKLLDETEQPSTVEPIVAEKGEQSANRQQTLWEMGASKSPGVVSAVFPHISSSGFDATATGKLKARITTACKAATPTAQPPPAGANPRRDIDITSIVVETVDDSSSDAGTVPSTISPPRPPRAVTINRKQAPRDDSLLLLDSDDLDDFESDASQLRNACLSRNAEPTALKSMLEICGSNQQRIEQAKKVAAELRQYRKWGELCTTLSVVSKAMAMAEPIVEQGTRDQINPPEARTSKRSVASMIVEKDVFSLICTMRAHDERRLDAALALMQFARGDDDATKNEIRSQGGDRLLLRLFRTHGIPQELKLVSALAFAYFLPSFVIALSLSSSSMSPLFALKILDCLQFGETIQVEGFAHRSR